VVHYLTEELVRRGHEVVLFASGDSRTSAELSACVPEALRLGGHCGDPTIPEIIQIDRVSEQADRFDVLHFHTGHFHLPAAARLPLPFLNTMILLLSGCTVTWAHHALLENDRKSLITGLALTVGLGLLFTGLQAWEYSMAPFAFTGGVYPSVFFLATGFHGFHVIVGTIFLAVCLFRAIAGHFTPERHFGFEAAAWYWHFVDVVWLFLFVSIYVFGAGEIAHH
jgi:heme/copper-type cytochrome/quinol oxidase subunit 3